MIGIGTAAIWLTTAGFSDQYDDLVKKGYRWVTADGPFACRSKDDVQRLINNQTEENRLKMVSQGGVYRLSQPLRRASGSPILTSIPDWT